MDNLFIKCVFLSKMCENVYKLIKQPYFLKKTAILLDLTYIFTYNGCDVFNRKVWKRRWLSDENDISAKEKTESESSWIQKKNAYS